MNAKNMIRYIMNFSDMYVMKNLALSVRIVRIRNLIIRSLKEVL